MAVFWLGEGGGGKISLGGHTPGGMKSQGGGRGATCILEGRAVEGKNVPELCVR